MIRRLMASSALLALISAGAITAATAADNATKPTVKTEAAATNSTDTASTDKKLVPDTPTLATAFIGRSVYSSQDPESDNIGDVNDLIIDNNGAITDAVIGVGGFLGIGEKNVAVPFEDLKVVERNGEIRLIYSATRDQLKAAPALDLAQYDPAARYSAQQAASNTMQQPGAVTAPANPDDMSAAPAATGDGTAPRETDQASAGGQQANDQIAANNQDNITTGDQSATGAPDMQSFVKQAAVGNMFEIQSSKLALDQAQNQDVKDFAQRMIDDHTKAGDDLQVALQNASADITVPDALDQEHQDKLNQLKNASGGDFDKQYVEMQLRAHKQTVNLFKGYAEGGDNDALKTFAQNTLPTLKDHLQRIQDIAGSNLASAGQQQNVAKADQKTVASASGKETSNQPTSGQINDAFRVYNPDQIRASTLIDKDVYGPDNKSIGTISDLVLEQDGKTRAALIDVGGFLGVGEKTVAIPFDDLQVSADASAKKSADANAKAGNVQVTVAMTEDQLKQLPAYEQPSAKRTAMQQPASDNSQQPAAGNADTASNQTAASDQANNPPAAEKQPSQEKKIVTGSINKNGSPASSQLGSQEVPASELMGATVYGSDNQSIGEIGDILFSKEGTIDAVVVDVGGFLGIGEKPVAVRFDSLNVREDQGKKVLVSVNTTEDQLKKAPKYERQSQ